MTIQFTELIIQQIKVLAVMFSAGVLVESFRQVKKIFCVSRQKREKAEILRQVIMELIFWTISFFIVSMFLYYASYGKLSVHGLLGFLSGVLLWKKICCDIITAWVKTDEAKSIKTTARSSIWKQLENKGWKKDVRKEQKEEKELRSKQQNTRGKRAIRRSKTRRKILIAIIIGAIIAVLLFFVMNIFSLKKEQHDVKKEREQLEQRKVELQKELKEIGTPENVEEQARDQLRLIKPGEVLYLFPDEMTNDSNENNKETRE